MGFFNIERAFNKRINYMHCSMYECIHNLETDRSALRVGDIPHGCIPPVYLQNSSSKRVNRAKRKQRCSTKNERDKLKKKHPTNLRLEIVSNSTDDQRKTT